MKKFKLSLLAAGALSVTFALTGCFHEELAATYADGDARSVEDLDSFDQGVQTDQETASLSGVVQMANSDTNFSKAGSRLPYYAPDVSGQTLEGTPLGGALVLAVDAWGNTVTSQADAGGGFDMTLDAGKLYAVIFIDTRSMEVLGSLVQASDTTKAAAVALANNTKLGNVVIDPVAGRAVSEADATPDTVEQEAGVVIKVVDASALDADGDGRVTQDDITNLQARALEEAIASGEDVKITKLSPINFMGDRNTWIAEFRGRDGEEHPRQERDPDTNQDIDVIFKGSTTEGTFRLVREKLVNGPDGSQVTALKRGQLTFFNEQKGALYKNNGDKFRDEDFGGYYSATVAKYNADNGSVAVTELPQDCQDRIAGNPNEWVWCHPYSASTFQGIDASAKFDWKLGIWAWSEYQFADQAAGEIAMGRWNHETRSVEWGDDDSSDGDGGEGGGIPLEIELGVVITETDANGTFTFSVDLVKDGLLTDTLGNKLPIILITSEEDGRKEAFYIVAKYGAEVNATNAAGEIIPWQTAFKKVRFGMMSRGISDQSKVAAVKTKICKDVADAKSMLVGDKHFVICMTSPTSVTLADGTTIEYAGAMPKGVGSTDTRNSWLGFIARNMNQLEVVDFENFDEQGDPNSTAGGSGGYFWVEYDEQGYGAVEPISWDPVNYVDYPLIAGTSAQAFTSTRTPDSTYGSETATDVNIHYNGVGVTFYYELRVFDPNATNAQNSAMKGDEVVVAKGVSVTAPDATDDATISVVGTLDVPDFVKGSMTLADNTSKSIETWTHWESNGATESVYCATGATLWLVMSADADGDTATADSAIVMEQPVGWYTIKGSALASTTENCDSFTAAGTP